MGRSTTPRYAIHLQLQGIEITPGGWQVSPRNGCLGLGKPTFDNLDKWVTKFETSMLEGPNDQLGYHPVLQAWIVDQRNGDTVASWARVTARPDEPIFQVI